MRFQDRTVFLTVATKCVCCRRPLKDAMSAEIGMGPICRKRWGFETIPPADAIEADLVESLLGNYGDLVEQTLEGRALANALVKRLASTPQGSRAELGWIPRALDAIGYRQLALRIAKTAGCCWLFQALDNGDSIVACPSGHVETLLSEVPGAKRDRKEAGFRAPLRFTPEQQRELAGTFFCYLSSDDGGIQFS